MKKKIWIAAGVVAIILVFVGATVYRTYFKAGPKVDTVQLKEAELSQTVMIPGTLELKNDQEIYLAPENGTVDVIQVKPGDQVKKGTVLFKYSNEQFNLEAEQNKLAEESISLKMTSLDDQINRLKEKKKDLEKAGQKDAAQELDPQIDQLELEKQMAEIERKQQDLQKNALQKRLAQLEVKSEVDGVVLEVNDPDALQGQNAYQKPLIHIGDLKNVVATGEISEYDTLKVKAGQAVKLKTEAVPDKEWKGKVQSVAVVPKSAPEGMGAEVTAVQYPVEVLIESRDLELKPGFQLIMEIETEKRKAMTLPVDAVVTEDDESIVYVVEKGKAVRKTVKVGLMSGDKVEIVSGLSEKDIVINKPDDKLKDGMEVRAK